MNLIWVALTLAGAALLVWAGLRFNDWLASKIPPVIDILARLLTCLLWIPLGGIAWVAMLSRAVAVAIWYKEAAAFRGKPSRRAQDRIERASRFWLTGLKAIWSVPSGESQQETVKDMLRETGLAVVFWGLLVVFHQAPQWLDAFAAARQASRRPEVVTITAPPETVRVEVPAPVPQPVVPADTVQRILFQNGLAIPLPALRGTQIQPPDSASFRIILWELAHSQIRRITELRISLCLEADRAEQLPGLHAWYTDADRRGSIRWSVMFSSPRQVSPGECLPFTLGAPDDTTIAVRPMLARQGGRLSFSFNRSDALAQTTLDRQTHGASIVFRRDLPSVSR